MTWKLKKKRVVELNNMHKNVKTTKCYLFYSLLKIWKQNNDTGRESLMSFAAILALKTLQSYSMQKHP